jgi:two-component system CheB/CheR fusion protein
MIGRDLTTRQQEIRDLVARGLTSKQVAAQLGISRRTVEDHKAEIYRKMGVSNVVEMMRALFNVEGANSHG